MNLIEPINAGMGPMATISGRATEVIKQLGSANLAEKGEHVVAFVLAGSSKDEAKTIQEVLSRIIHLTQGRLTNRSDETLSSLVDTLLPKELPSPTVMKEAQMLLKAKTAVLDGAQWLLASDVAAAAGFSAKNPSAQPNKWKSSGAIFTISKGGVDYYPGYALDPANQYRPYPSLKAVLKHFQGAKDGWGTAFWFQSANSYLGGARPMDVLGTTPDAVIAAAADEVAGVAHA